MTSRIVVDGFACPLRREHAVERPRHVLRKMVAQAVELQAGGTLEIAGAHSGRGNAGEDEEGQEGTFHAC